MKKVLLFIVLILLAFSVYWFMLRTKKSGPSQPKQAPIALQKHSDSFNVSIDRAIDAYLNMKNAFVESDTVGIKSNANLFIKMLDTIPVEELKKDTAMIFETVQANIEDIKANTASLVSQTSIDEMRKDFSMVTELMYPSFFRAINYEGKKLYLQHCPMAFDEEKGANWISNSEEVINPYLGKQHPKYKATMLHCGELMDTIKPAP